MEYKPVALSPEDAAAMARLYEEVAGRLEEMGLIMDRVLGGYFKGPFESAIVRFKRSPQFALSAVPLHALTCEWGCYDFERMICRPCGPDDFPHLQEE